MSFIKVNISEQVLRVFDQRGKELAQFPVSTSLYGAGNREGSFQTPLGRHRVCEKIGQAMAEDEVFIGRQPQGRLSELTQQQTELPDDIITARILRLSGLEPGLNAGHDAEGNNIDSFERYIYIHGTADEARISQPVSHGCVRMRNQDIIALYDMIDIDTEVLIEN